MKTESELKSSDKLATAFNGKDAKGAAELYSPSATWTLSNGKTLVGRAAIQGFLTKAIEGGANTMQVSAGSSQGLKGGEFSTSEFSFMLGDGKRVSGLRYTARSAGLIQSDVWLPDTPSVSAPELDAALTQYSAAMNSSEAAPLIAVFTSDASMVLSDATYVAPDDLKGFMEKTSQFGIRDMKTEGATHRVFGDHALSTTAYSLTIPIPDNPIHLTGKRVLAWAKTPEGWKVAHETSWNLPN